MFVEPSSRWKYEFFIQCSIEFSTFSGHIYKRGGEVLWFPLGKWKYEQSGSVV